MKKNEMDESTYYEKNITALKKISPPITEWINNEKEIDWGTIVYTKNHPNLLIKKGAKNELAYKDSNPNTQTKKLIKNLSFDKDCATVIVGFGLGYLAKNILTKADKKHRLIIVEPIASIFKYAFQFHDFSEHIEQGNLTFATPGMPEVSLIIGVLENSTVINNWQIIINDYTNKRPDEYFKLTKHTIETINQVRCNTGTVMGAGKIIADNDINNLPYVIRHRGIIELKDLFTDKPAVLVCTGPSLEKNIWELKSIENNVIIIAVAQALRILLAYDIKPDFITTVDFGKTNLGHYKGLMDSDVPLVCLNRTYREILKKYRGPKFIVATPVPGHEHTAAGILTGKGHIDSGGSVAHLSFMLGYYMGCNPLIMIGQDLALTGNKSHFAQADECGIIHSDIEKGLINWEVKDHRSHLVKEKKGEKPIYSMGAPLSIPGYFGKLVFTNTGLASFILAFKNLFEAYCPKNGKRIVINSTEGGAKLEGTKQLSFHKTIENYCQNSIDKSVITPLLTLSPDSDKLIDEVIPRLRKDIDNLNFIEKEANKALKWGRKAKNCKEKSTIARPARRRKKEPDLKACIKENEIHTLQTYEASKENPLVGVAIFNESRLIQSKELKVKGKLSHIIRNKKDLFTRIKRNRIILTAAKKAAISLRKGYKDTLKILEDYQKTKDEALLIDNEEEIPSIKDAFIFFKRGNFARPLLEARKLIKNKIDGEFQYFTDSKNNIFRPYNAYHIEKIALDLRNKSIKKAKKRQNKKEIDKLLLFLELMDENKNLGKEELKKEIPDFKEACKLLEKAVKLYPENETSLWGYATTLHHTDQFEKSIEQYKKLIQIIEEKLNKIHFTKREEQFITKFKEKHKEDDFETQKKIQLKLRKFARLIHKESEHSAIKKKLLLFKYELGQVILISGKVQEGLRAIREVMNQTKEFDVFFQRMGDLYFDLQDLEKALEAYSYYLKAFPEDFVAWGKLGDCYKYLNKPEKAERAYKKLLKLKPEEKINEFYILKKKAKKIFDE